jgi:hypothetical protein
VEGRSLTMRIGMPCFTALMNGISKELENHVHVVALHFVFTSLDEYTRRYGSHPGDGDWSCRSCLEP